MVQSAATTVEDYLAGLPAPRQTAIRAVRELVNRHLPAGYAEAMAFGMIGWGVPLARYPVTYNKQPLSYLGLAAQKNYNTLYLMGVYADSEDERRLRDGYASRGLKLDFGKCCLRFKDGALPPEEVVGPIIAGTSVERFIALYEHSRATTAQGRRG